MTSFQSALQNDASSWWVAMTFNLSSTASQFLWSTQSNSTAAGMSLTVNPAGSPKFNMVQYGTASKQIIAWSPTSAPTTSAEAIVVVSHNAGGNTRIWFNSVANTLESTNTFNSVSVSGTKMTVGSRGTAGYIASGTHISHFSYGTGYLGNTQAGEIIHLIESRHQVDYDGNGTIGN